MPTDPDPLNIGDRANPAPCVDPDPVAFAPDPGVVEGVDQDCDRSPDDDCDDVTPCWCGESNPLFDDEGLDATCDGSGTLVCHCGGDLCVCHHHGETECPGCEHCAELEGDDDGPFEDGDELDGESGEACCRCGATVDVGRYRGRWICDDCDDNEED